MNAAPSWYWVPLPIVGMGHLTRRKRESQKEERAMECSSLLHPAHCFLPSLVEEIRGWLEGQDPWVTSTLCRLPRRQVLGKGKVAKKDLRKS